MNRRITFFLLMLFAGMAATQEWDQLERAQNRFVDIRYAERNLQAASLLSAEGDRFVRQLAGELGLDTPERPIPVILDPQAAGRNEVYPTPRWINGFYRPDDGIIVLKTVKSLNRWKENELLSVFKHEIVHALIDYNGVDLPLWLEEGIAQNYTRGFTLLDGRRLLGVSGNKMKSLLADDAFRQPETAPMAYAMACGAVAYLRELGRENLRQLIHRLDKETMDRAFVSVYGTSVDTFLIMFRESFLSRYTMLSLLVSDEGLLLLLSLLAVVLLVMRRIRTGRKLKQLEDSGSLHPADPTRLEADGLFPIEDPERSGTKEEKDNPD